MNYTPYIMCGGKGSRLLPLSTPEKPKPFHRLISETETMLQITAKRFENPTIICNNLHTGLVCEQLGEGAHIIPEKEQLGTLNAAVTACNYTDDLVLLVPSDHYISDTDVLHATIARGMEVLSKNPETIVVFGIKPTYPESQYGYVLNKLVEKPNVKDAYDLIERGYYWNSGMFLFHPEFLKYKNPEEYLGWSLDTFLMINNIPVTVLPLKTDWIDLGTFKSIYNVLNKKLPTNGNVGLGSFSCFESHNNLILNYRGEEMHIRNMSDCVIIVDNDENKFIRGL